MRTRRWARLGSGDRGSVTAETAIALPAVILVLVAVLTIAVAAGAQMRAADGARAGARAVAIGESDESARAIAQQVAGSSAAVDVTRGDPWTQVQVSVPVAGSWFGALRASGQAVAWTEPSARWPGQNSP
jgi:Flp pilus assembly protein TadG